eukprot:699261-Pleurochrysis_carterae.AAC.1
MHTPMRTHLRSYLLTARTRALFARVYPARASLALAASTVRASWTRPPSAATRSSSYSRLTKSWRWGTRRT